MRVRNHNRSFATAPEPVARLCDWPDCAERGDYPAPWSRAELRRYRWFCLAHVRAYNSAWNYYDGMDDREVEADIRADVVWRRRTWRFGSGVRAAGEQCGVQPDLHDSFGLFDEEPGPQQPHQTPASPAVRAMQVLDLVPPVTLAAVKARYKELVKRHHPDANGGDKAAEERFKQINEAYRTVIHSLTI